MITFTKFIGCGHTTAVPVLRIVKGNKPLANFTIAVNESYKKGESWIEETNYIDFVCCGAFAEAVKDLPTGTKLYLEGRLSSSTWEDKESGKKRFKLEVVIEKLRSVPTPAAKREDKEQQPETTNA